VKRLCTSEIFKDLKQVEEKKKQGNELPHWKAFKSPALHARCGVCIAWWAGDLKATKCELGGNPTPPSILKNSCMLPGRKEFWTVVHYASVYK